MRFWHFILIIFSVVGLCAPTALFAKDMQFRLVPFGDMASCEQQHCIFVISADGDITNDTPDQFAAFAKVNMKNPRVRAVVFLNSAGGGVMASMALGQMFRKVGVLAIIGHLNREEGGPPASTYVPAGRCYSACVYAFIGAKKRIVPPYSLVGIHRMYSYEATGTLGREHKIFGDKEFVDKLADYARRMGVSRAMVRKAETIDSTKIHIVTPDELKRWNIAAENF